MQVKKQQLELDMEQRTDWKLGQEYDKAVGSGGSDGKETACDAGDLGWEDPLEEGMSTHSVFLPGASPGTEEPDGL